MRFDDILDTVLTADLRDPLAARSAWRQLLDLLGRGKVAADARTMAMLEELQQRVPLATRSAAARALFGMMPPAPLVRLLASDDIAVAAPVLRAAALTSAEWIETLPMLSAAGRAVLRHRRDLPADVVRALEAFGAVDFVLERDTSPQALSVADGQAASVAFQDNEPFAAIGPVAAKMAAEQPVPAADDRGAEPSATGSFRIADVVARISAYQQGQAVERARPTPPPAAVPSGRFRFETGAAGIIRWADGAPRAAVIGHRLDRQARPGAGGVDGVAAGAFRRRARFDDARLVLDGGSEAGGLWLVSAVPVFDPATGRFTGYRGNGRRPVPHEIADAGSADAMRQVVHELRTPTNAIAGFSDMIAQAMLGPVRDIYRVQAAEIRREATRLMGAIDDVDTAARISASALDTRPEAVDLRTMMSRIADELSQLARAHEARIEVAGDPVVALADGRSVERVLCRLGATMLAASARGEVITALFAADVEAVTVTVDLARALVGRSVDELLAMDDEGSGGGPLLGTGFALRLSRNIAQQLGGSLTFGSETLTLTLPAALVLGMEQPHPRHA